MLSRIKAFIKYIRDNRFDRSLMRYFDWPLLIIVLVISFFGVVCIFSATSTQVLLAIRRGNFPCRGKLRNICLKSGRIRCCGRGWSPSICFSS